MIDAYTHLDISAPDPIAEFLGRMLTAGVGGALAVETWNGENFPCLERIVGSHIPEFRVAPCFRPEAGLPTLDFLSKDAVVALRVKTVDLSRLERIADFLEASRKWLLAHAENGIRELVEQLICIRKKHPRLPVYIPHMAWPRREGLDDKDWGDSIARLRQVGGLTVGISAIAHFSREPFPHHDAEIFASRLLQLFPAERLAVASDYPMFEKTSYAQYMELAIEWVERAVGKWSPAVETTWFPKEAGASQ